MCLSEALNQNGSHLKNLLQFHFTEIAEFQLSSHTIKVKIDPQVDWAFYFSPKLTEKTLYKTKAL